MPSVLSKFKESLYGREWSFPYNCYEVGHGWTPYCSGAACEIGYATFKNALPIYTSLYLFTQLGLQRKYTPQAFLETGRSILTSSSFLSFNFFSGIVVSCLLRNNSDRYYYRAQCFLPGFIAAYLALLIERPSRRPALAFYIANMSSELLYKWAENYGYIRSLPHGETILFTLGMACWLRFVRIHGFGHDPVSTAVKYLIGPLEAKSRAKVRPIEASHDGEISEVSETLLVDSGKKNKQHKKSTMILIDEAINNFLNNFFSCHPICPHKGVNCVHYSLTPAITRFLMGYLAKSILGTVSKPQLLLKKPVETIKYSFTSRNSINTGLFLGTFVGASKAVHCILRRIQNKQETWHSAVAGGISGLSMLFAPKSTLSTYIIWKCLEQYFFLAVKNGQIKRADEVICLTYAVSVNILLYIFAIEPSFIRPSYMKFLDQISDHRLHQLNRMVLDVFGPRASIGYEDWFPDLDPKYMSREFHELIFNWLIQPH